MNIHDQVLKMVESGAKFNIDFKARSLTVNGKPVIKNGVYEGELGVEKQEGSDFLKVVEKLYDPYKHSMPSARSEERRKRYFYAYPEAALPDEDMLFGCKREPWRFMLEYYVLCQILMGLRWDEQLMGRWFWQSEDDPDLIILREWIEN